MHVYNTCIIDMHTLVVIEDCLRNNYVFLSIQELRTSAIAKPLELNELENGIKKSVISVKVCTHVICYL